MITSLLLVLNLFLSTAINPAWAEDSFSFHLFAEPTLLDPIGSQSASGSYLVNNLYRGLFKYNSQKGLVLEGAKTCKETHLKLVCELDPTHKWSDGKVVQAGDYVAAFRRLIDPESKSPQAELLFSLKNAENIYQGKIAKEKLGVQALSDSTLQIEFQTLDPEFKYKLSLPALSPYRSQTFPKGEKANELITSGPYKIKKWKVGHQLDLTPNPHWPNFRKLPPVEIYFVDDDSTALNLYLSGKLKFLRRLVTDKIQIFKTRPDFFQFPFARFDYIGFSGKLKNDFKTRKLLSESLDYKALQSVYQSVGTPGCPTLSPKYQQTVHCHKFKQETPNSKTLEKLKLTLAYSKMGGEDIQKGMEWLEHQWKTRTGLKLELRPMEQGYYIQELKNQKFDIFRKGVGLDRPTCLAALEIFLPHHPENYIGLNDPKFNKAVDELKLAKSVDESKKLCSKAIQILIDEAYIIPLGEFYFSILASPQFTGWSLNELNQLDLSELRYKN